MWLLTYLATTVTHPTNTFIAPLSPVLAFLLVNVTSTVEKKILPLKIWLI